MNDIPTEVVSLNIADGTKMNAALARPHGKPLFGIIVLQEAFGVNDYIRNVARRFASREYLAIAPELYHRTAPGFEGSYTDFGAIKPHMDALTDDGLVQDIQAAYDALIHEGIPAGKIAVIGFCMGGKAAFLANATLPVVASASFYGGGIAQSHLDKVKDLHAPQLLVWGGNDSHILPEHRQAVAEAMKAGGKPYVEAVFSEAPHGFACDVRDSYHAPSARMAWALADQFLTECVQ